MTTVVRPRLSSYLIFGLLPFNSVFSSICSPGFTQVCPLVGITCPDTTEMICPLGAETQLMKSLDRNGEPDPGCQCVPDFLISHVKDKAESRASDNVAPDIFKKLKIKIGERNCKCNLKIILTGNQIDSKSNVKCDKKCSGKVEGVTLEAKSGNVYNATIQVTKGKGKVTGTLYTDPSSGPSSPACTCVEEKESQGGRETVENEVTFSENGETFVQTDSYNPKTGEAKLTVPAHGNYEKATYIMQGRSSGSPIAGKMIVSSGNLCSLEDIPAFIDVEGMMVDGRHQMINVRSEVEVKQYQIWANSRRATEEEYNDLTDSMKKECKGKSILVSSTEIIDEDQFERQSMSNFSSIIQRAKGVKQQIKGCNNVYYGCALSSPRSCVRWTYPVLGTTAQPTDQPFWHVLNGVTHYCTRCCKEENTSYIPCSCITDERIFSTAFAISRQKADWGYDCLKHSRYCMWKDDEKVDCNYKTDGSCVWDQNCPMNHCGNQDCTTTTTTTTTTTV